ncbi:MAG TPA: D-alanyl-D-alanine carboxypeptidase family protein [Caulobacteraceae bacterium]|jgi:hypothetical protein
MKLGRGFAVLLALALLGVAVLLTYCQHRRPPPSPATTPVAARPTEPDCGRPQAMSRSAADNAASLSGLAFSPFRAPEAGWETYAPQVAREIGSGCPPTTLGFARDLAAWQSRRGLVPDGRMTAETFEAFRLAWHRRRPLRGKLPVQACPPPPPPEQLVEADPSEGLHGKVVKLRPAVLEAWRKMRQAARREDPAIAKDPLALVLVSGYRDPASDALRCAVEGNCDNRRRALCSAHRTGLVFDLYVGAAPGSDPTSTDPRNRLYQSRTPAYRWLVKNARRFGFENYVYEPWHWEWSGPSEFGTPAPAAP